MVKLVITEEHAAIIYELLQMDGASDYIGKNTDLDWEQVSEAAETVGHQMDLQMGEDELDD